MELHGSCTAQPLTFLFLLGQKLQLGNKLYMICPQDKCGCVMVLNTSKCAFTDRGPACSVCTELIKEERKPIPRYDHQQPVPCDNECKQAPGIHMYPYGVKLCGRCHNKRLKQNMEDHTSSSFLSKEHVITVIRDYIQKNKEYKKKRGVEQGKAGLLLSKRMTKNPKLRSIQRS